MIKWSLVPAAIFTLSVSLLLAHKGGRVKLDVGDTRAVTKSTQTVARPATVAVAPVYPLKMSANHRYFVDQNNLPVLLIGDSPQSLLVKLTPTQQDTYFNNRHSKGFNAVWVNLLCDNNTGGNANGKTDGGVAPFTSGSSPATYDLATPNTPYFSAADTMINLASTYGLNVVLDPIETIGWLPTLRNNGPTKAFNYGVYLGNRYKNLPNLLWFHGNDFGTYTDPTDNNLVGQVMAGIASVDPNHLQTILLFAEFNFSPYMVYSNLDSSLSSFYGANAAYTYAPVYDAVLNAYASTPTTPVMMAESYYEFEDNLNSITAPPGVADAYVLRTISWFTLTSGGIGGYIYGNHNTWLSTWPADPANLLDTPGAAQIAHINTLMNQINWWTLAPDTSHVIVTSGYGTYTNVTSDPRNTNYCTTGFSPNLSLTYCPKAATLTVAMSQFSGSVTARWYDPSNGTFTSISGSPFDNTGTHNFTTPGNNADGNPDWVLLLQGPTTSVPVSLPNLSPVPGISVAIPVSVGNLSGLGVRAYDLQITFNPAVVQPQAIPFDIAGTLSSGMAITPNATNPGHLIISGLQATDLIGSGTLLKIKFTVVGTPGQNTQLAFQDYTDPAQLLHPGFRFNAGNPQNTTTNGSLTINTPTAAPASLFGRVTRSDGTPMAGVGIDLSDGAVHRTITDLNGNYHFENLEPGSFYTVIPLLSNYHFSPESRSFSTLGNQSEAGFVATPDVTVTGNAINTTEFFVRQQYLDFLGREPDRGGLEFWSAQINQCGSNDTCISKKRIDVSAAFFQSEEFQVSGGYVYDLYTSLLGRRPAYVEFNADRSQVIGGSGLDQSKTVVAEGFMQRPELLARYPQSMTGEQFVDAVLLTMQQRSGLDLSSIRAGLLSDYNGGGRALVARHAAETPSFASTEYNQAFVLMEYFGYLRREVDQNGYLFWLGVLNNTSPNNYRGMVCAFITSTEYQHRFSPVVTRSNAECH